MSTDLSAAVAVAPTIRDLAAAAHAAAFSMRPLERETCLDIVVKKAAAAVAASAAP